MLELLQGPFDKPLPPFEFDVVSRANTPLALGHGSAGTLNGDFYQLGGYNSAGVRLNRVFKYSPISNVWVEVAPCPETFQPQSINFEFNERLVTVNFAGTGFFRYNPFLNNWSVPNTPAFPEAINGTRPFAIYGDKLIVCLFNNTTSIVVYDLKLNKWDLIIPPTPPDGGSVYSHYQNKLYIISRFKNLVALNLDTFTWEELTPIPIAGTTFYGADCFSYNGNIYVVGGWNGSGVNQLCFVYNIKTNTWTQPRSIPESGYTNNVRGINGRFYLLKANSTGGTTSGTPTFTRLN